MPTVDLASGIYQLRLFGNNLFELLATSENFTLGNSMGTYTAASCARADVDAVINGPTHTAVDGDVIIIPAGSCNWNTTGITVPDGIGITIMGAGTPDSSPTTFVPSSSCYSATTINMSGSVVGFTANPHYDASTFRLSCMTLHASGDAVALFLPGVCSGAASDCPGARIDNINWTGWGSVAHPGNSYGLTSIGDIFGVLDHNDVDNHDTGNYAQFVEVNHGQFLGVGNFGDNSWATPDYYGTKRFLFFENNTFRNAGTSENEGLGGYGGPGGMRIVVRFNTFENPNSAQFAAGWHEMRGRDRGGRNMEFYKNIWNCNTGDTCSTTVALRGGTALQWGNTFFIGPTSSMPTLIDAGTARSYGALSGVGACDGSQPWDNNDGVTYFSGTVASVSGQTITVSGTNPGWTTDQWFVLGAPYAIRNVTQNTGTEIHGNGSNTILMATSPGFPGGGWVPQISDSIQILKATACLDASARGDGVLYTGSDINNAPTPAVSADQEISPIYSWLNAFTGRTDCRGGECIIYASGARQLRARDYFWEDTNQAANSGTGTTTPFDGDGTPNIGHGARANRPTNCTTGVVYWATDQGSWNASGSGGQGVLDKCTSTNTWTNAVYVPYDYPHPLISGATPSTAASRSAMFLAQ